MVMGVGFLKHMVKDVGVSIGASTSWLSISADTSSGTRLQLWGLWLWVLSG